jgi:long-chain acyl-CoA synthetase
MNDKSASEILNSLPERISDVIARWTGTSPNQICLVESGGKWTYRELSAAVDEAQRWLAERGVRPGDRVMIVCENCRAFVAVLLASARLDAWPVLVNARLSAREVDEIREHSRARLVVYTAVVSSHAREHARRHGAMNEEVGFLGTVSIARSKDSVSPEPLDENPRERIAAMIYTSGTTGHPKGVMLTHQNLLYVAAGSARIRRLTPGDRVLGVLPMSHAVGLSVVLLGTLLSGATLYLSQRFDPVAACKILENDHLTIFLGVPSMFSLLVEYARMKRIPSLRSPALRIISSSGAPLQAALKKDVEDLLGLPLHNGYGVTECSPTIAQADIDEPCRGTSVGRVFPGVEVKIVGADGRTAAEGEAGELRVRGPNVMKGYYRSPDETRAAIDPDGWFNTHDLARFEDGHLYIVGRAKELIIRFGFNVYPAEVESVLASHPGVVRCAVIGRRTEGAEDEQIIAFVQPEPQSSITTADLSRYAAQRLAAYKVPTEIRLMRELPLTPTGKISKARLAEMIGSGIPTI